MTYYESSRRSQSLAITGTYNDSSVIYKYSSLQAVPPIVSMSSVPPELLFCILEYGYYTLSGTPNYKHLKACSLVCRAWSGPAQSILFRSAINLGNHNFHMFYAALLSSAARGRPLGDCVRTLGVCILGPSPSQPLTQAIHCSQKLNLPASNTQMDCSPLIIAELLQACPQVYELVLSFFQVDLDEEILEKLRVPGQRLKRLSLGYFGTQSHILFHLLRIWPDIQVLTTRSYIHSPGLPTTSLMLQRNTDDTGELAHQNGVQTSLYHLVLTVPMEPEALAWLLASSANSLCILDLQVPLYLRGQNIFAHQVPPLHSLRSLRLSWYDDDTITLLRLCTSLEELVFDGFHLPPCCPLASNLPPTIQHLAFTIGNYKCRVTLQPIIDAVDTLPNLRVLTCNQNMRRQLYDEYAILERRCKLKGAEMVVSDFPYARYGILQKCSCHVLT